jgi:hypothetical protein
MGLRFKVIRRPFVTALDVLVVTLHRCAARKFSISATPDLQDLLGIL